MECDFCVRKARELPFICCPSGERACYDCVSRGTINTATLCSVCERPLGTKIKPLMQGAYQARSQGQYMQPRKPDIGYQQPNSAIRYDDMEGQYM